MTQVMPITDIGIERKKGETRGLERRHWLCLQSKSYTPKIWR